MFLIFLVVLVLFGAKRLPELARSLGRSAVEFKKARREFDDEVKKAEKSLELEDNAAKPQDTIVHPSEKASSEKA